MIWASRKRDMENENEWKIIQVNGESVTNEDFDFNVNKAINNKFLFYIF